MNKIENKLVFLRFKVILF